MLHVVYISSEHKMIYLLKLELSFVIPRKINPVSWIAENILKAFFNGYGQKIIIKFVSPNKLKYTNSSKVVELAWHQTLM